MTNSDDTFNADYLSNDYLANATSQVVGLWLSEHGMEPSDLLKEDPFPVVKKWLEPLTVEIQVISDLFPLLGSPDEEPFHGEAPNFEVYCTVTPTGLQAVFQFKSAAVPSQKGPAAVTAILPYSSYAPKPEAEQFLSELWEDWLKDTNPTLELQYTIIDPETAWESHSVLGDTAFQWLKSLEKSTLVFTAPIKTDEECQDFMNYASGYVLDNMIVVNLNNPFLTRIEGEVEENIFTLLVGTLDS